MVFNAGTEVLLVYTSTLVEGAYTVYGSMTSSDDINRVDPFDDDTILVNHKIFLVKELIINSSTL